jgi:hypothetical protein
MEKNNTSEISWVLVGVRPRTEQPLEEAVLHKILQESFEENRTYTLFLCGTEVDKSGTLDEMEEGFRKIKDGVEEYSEGDYCIISKHEEGDLLFMPAIIEEDDLKETPMGDA